MPLPDTPTLIEGGCNCGAIRYRVDIPAEHERPIYPLGGGHVDPPVRMPFVCTDHCNDCRRATGALLPFWLLCPTDMISISLVQKSSELEDGRLDTSRVPRGPWISALDVFLAKGPVEDTYLSFFASSPDRRRSFCQRCGTMFAFCAFPTPDFIKFPMLDLLLGTIDRYILEERFLSPERQLHWQTGIDWIREFSKDGLEGVPVYLTSNVATSMALTK